MVIICLHFSQSYDIGKMNTKYAPGSEVQVNVVHSLAEARLYAVCVQMRNNCIVSIVFNIHHSRQRLCGS